MSRNVRRPFPAGRKNMQCIFHGDFPCLVVFQTGMGVLTSHVQDDLYLWRAGFLLLCEIQWCSQNYFLRFNLFLCLSIPVGTYWCLFILCLGEAQQGKCQVVFKVLGITLLALVERPKGGRTWCTSGYSDRELDHSLYKLRSAQLEILQKVEQLGQILLQLWDRSRSGEVWDSQDIPRNIQTQHLPGDKKSSLNAIRTWVTGWLCCVIISITSALSAWDFSADPQDNPAPCDSKGCCSSPGSATPPTPLLCAELSAVLSTWWEDGQPQIRVEEYQQKLAKSICLSCQSLSVISFFFLLFFSPPSFTQSSVFRISCLQAALCIQLNLRLWLSHKRGERWHWRVSAAVNPEIFRPMTFL